MTLIVKVKKIDKCYHCGGDLYWDHDIVFGWERKCLQCSRPQGKELIKGGRR